MRRFPVKIVLFEGPGGAAIVPFQSITLYPETV